MARIGKRWPSQAAGSGSTSPPAAGVLVHCWTVVTADAPSEWPTSAMWRPSTAADAGFQWCSTLLAEPEGSR